MGWTSPRTYVAGEIITANILNTHVRDNERYLKGTDGEIILEDYIDFPSTAQGDVFYHNGTKLARLAAGTSGYILSTNGAGANPTWENKFGEYEAGSTLGLNSGGAVTTASNTYVLMKSIRVGRVGTVTVVFDLRDFDSAQTAYGRIYRNGTAVGTERTTTSATYVTQPTENFGVLPGDLVQLYLHTAVGNGAYAQNFKITILSTTDTSSFRDES